MNLFVPYFTILKINKIVLIKVLIYRRVLANYGLKAHLLKAKAKCEFFGFNYIKYAALIYINRKYEIAQTF